MRAEGAAARRVASVRGAARCNVWRGALRGRWWRKSERGAERAASELFVGSQRVMCTARVFQRRVAHVHRTTVA